MKQPTTCRDYAGHQSSPFRLPILGYGSVPDVSLKTALPGSIPALRLQEQLAGLIRHGWKLVSLAEAVHAAGMRRERRVAVTFDGGLLDFLNASNILEAIDSRATIYVPVGMVGVRVSRWDHGSSRLGWRDLNEVGKQGFEVGVQLAEKCHERNTTFADIEAERRYIEDRLGRSIGTFCHVDRCRHIDPERRHDLARAGYQTGCTLRNRIASSIDDPLSLPRIRVTAGMTGDDLHVLLSNRSHPRLSALSEDATLQHLTRNFVSRTRGVAARAIKPARTPAWSDGRLRPSYEVLHNASTYR